MKDVSVTLTDFAITALTLFFCYRLATSGSTAAVATAEVSEIRMNFIALFAALAAGSLMGGIVHGFLPNPDARVTQIVWVLTLMSVGICAYNLWMVNLRLLSEVAGPVNDVGGAVSEAVGIGGSSPLILGGRWILRALLVAYVLVIFFVTQKFFVAIASYIPPALVLFIILAVRVLRDGMSSAKGGAEIYGAVGMLLTFTAAYIQQAQITLHPTYLNYNTLYHLIQGVGLTGLFLFAQKNL